MTIDRARTPFTVRDSFTPRDPFKPRDPFTGCESSDESDRRADPELGL